MEKGDKKNSIINKTAKANIEYKVESIDSDIETSPFYSILFISGFGGLFFSLIVSLLLYIRGIEDLFFNVIAIVIIVVSLLSVFALVSVYVHNTSQFEDYSLKIVYQKNKNKSNKGN